MPPPRRAAPPAAILFKLLLPPALLLVFLLLNPQGNAGYFEDNYPNLASGSALLSGLPLESVTRTLPLFPAAAAAAFNLGLTVNGIFLVYRACLLALSFFGGRLLAGYSGGIMAMAAAALASAEGNSQFNPEQAFFGLYLLLSALLLELRRRKGGYLLDMAAGLSLGGAMLLRSPAIIFPPLFAAFDWMTAPRRGAGLARSTALFLLASYALLLPWGLLNRHETGAFSLLEDRRSAVNLVGGALGATYTLDYDATLLPAVAGASPALLLAGRALERPLEYAGAVFRRLAAVFLFYPLLFSAAAAAAAAAFISKRGCPQVLLLPAAFLLLHALLPVEQRYLVPLTAALPALLVISLGRHDGEEPGPWLAASMAGLKTAFVLFAAAALAAALLALAYPWRSAAASGRGISLREAAGRFPRDRHLAAAACRELRDGAERPYLDCLRAYAGRFGDEAAACAAAALTASGPGGLRPPACGGAGTDLCVKARLAEVFRWAELGRLAQARAAYAQARRYFGERHNILQGSRAHGDRYALAPSPRDRLLASYMALDRRTVWQRFGSKMLTFWPRGRALALLERLEKTPGFDGVQSLRASWEGLEGGHRPGSRRGPAQTPAERNFSDCLSAAGAAPAGRLRACQAVIMAVETGAWAGNGGAEAAGDAYMESYRLLNSLGRRQEALEALNWAVSSAPPGWRRLAEARAELARAEAAPGR